MNPTKQYIAQVNEFITAGKVARMDMSPQLTYVEQQFQATVDDLPNLTPDQKADLFHRGVTQARAIVRHFVPGWSYGHEEIPF